MNYFDKLPDNLGEFILRKFSVNNFSCVDYSTDSINFRYFSNAEVNEKDINEKLRYEILDENLEVAEFKMLAKLNLIEQVKNDFKNVFPLEFNPICEIKNDNGKIFLCKGFTAYDLWNLEENTKSIAIISVNIENETDIIITWIKKHVKHDFSNNIRLAGDEFDSNDIIYNNVVYLYTTDINTDISKIKSKFKLNNLTVKIRDNTYRNNLKPDFFISHDSRDKEEIAKPLYEELTKKGFKVWYDEFSLKIGDSLTESIEKGISECEKGIIVLSKNFLSNGKWAKNELQSLKTRQIFKNEKVILPIWHGITPEDLKDNYWLIDKISINSKIGIKEIVEKITKDIQ